MKCAPPAIALGVAGAAVAGLWTGFACADPATKFFADRTVTLYIGAGEGGGYDTYSRVLARHIARHIPGNPTVISRNMPGAGSIKLANYLVNVAPKDGSAFGAVYNTLPVQPLIGRKGVKFRNAQLAWVGSIGKHQNICVTWHANSVRTFDQAKANKVVVASTGASGNSSVFPKLFNQILGTKFDVVRGYKSSEARLSVERGETEGICGMSYQTLLASDPDWILKKKLNILVQIGLKPHPALPGVPMVLDMVEKPADRDLLTFLMIPQEMGRPYVAPPGVPAARLTALRSAFDATMKDRAFLEGANRARMKIEPIDHAEMTALVAKLDVMPEETIRRATSLLTAKKK